MNLYEVMTQQTETMYYTVKAASLPEAVATIDKYLVGELDDDVIDSYWGTSTDEKTIGAVMLKEEIK